MASIGLDKKKCSNSKRKPKAKSHDFNNDWWLSSFKKSVYQSIREQYIHLYMYD